MKIIQISKFPPESKGGIEKLSNQYCIDLYSKNTRVDMICYQEYSKSRFEIFNTHTIYRTRTLMRFLSIPISIHNLYFLKKLINSYEYIHLHLPNPMSMIYTLICIKPKHKLTLHYHCDTSYKRFYNIYKFLQEIIIKKIGQNNNNLEKVS